MSITIYAQTINSITEIRTVNAHMGALGKIMAMTEDLQLSELIKSAVLDLQLQLAHGKGRPIPTSLMFLPTPSMFQLFQYCNYHKQWKRPEWQVVAEQNGWTPPKAKNYNGSAEVV